MRHLYVQIYVGFVAVGALCLVVSGLIAAWTWEGPDFTPVDAGLLVAAAAAVPDHELEASIEEVTRDTDLVVTVWGPDGRVLAHSGRGPHVPAGRPGWFRRRGQRGIRLVLDGGRVLGVAYRPPSNRRFAGLAWLIAVGLAIAAGSYPLARRITRRLELVQSGMARWGSGDLAARVPVEGRDEVAAVARSFNEAAEKVEGLFDAQRRVLASASHELRSPLTRLRLAIELAAGEGSEGERAWTEAAVRDIEELDATIEDALMVGRMQELRHPRDPEPVELRALLLEEAGHVGASVSGPEHTVSGNPRLLRRLARNLLENAARHGAPPLEVVVGAQGFSVCDRGPGVPAALRERIFEPFYRPSDHAEGRDGGVGLGLHLVREIARHHGGDVTCHPRPGGGAEFRVRLA